MHASTSLAVDVVVVGGGIVGTAAAAFLAGGGARVVLIEREGLASGASGANSGVVQHPFDPVLAPLYRETIALYRELAAVSTGFHLPSQPAGMLFVSNSEAEARRQAAVILETFPELTIEVFGGAHLQALEPKVAPDLWACRVGIGYPVMPGAATYAYASLAEARGAEIRQGHAAMLQIESNSVVGVRVDGRLLSAATVLVAAGPWTPGVLDPTGRWAPIRPLWGAVVEVELSAPPRHVLEQAGIEAAIGAAAVTPGTPGEHQILFSLVPLHGVCVVGSTFLADEPDPRAWMEPILQRASTFVPAVAEAPIRGVRACARPQSADGRPLIGAVPGVRGLYVCAGHGPWGISTGPASARIVSDLILGRAPQLASELHAARFGMPTG
ncbi:MAG TPA: FAD-dependent oxidoreductase [Candidatus Limnocylindrales bacterium]|nr:FAD-dependent oxidoreductase [Candidatus Limnocylindrales bacterium]